MAKSKWDEVKDKLILVEGWARDGLTELQIAKNLGISKSTLETYKKEHSDFLNALKRGKEVVDYEVENALLKKALNGDTVAMIFWLKNRRPDKWKDRKEHTEIDIANKELKLKERKIKLEEEKANGNDNKEPIKIEFVKASERNG